MTNKIQVKILDCKISSTCCMVFASLKKDVHGP